MMSKAKLETKHVLVVEDNPENVHNLLDNLKAGEKKYRDIYENAIEGIFQTTPEGRLQNANPSLAKSLGYASSMKMEI